MIFGGNAGHSDVDPGAVDPIEQSAGDYIDTKEAAWCREVMQIACGEITARGHQAIFIQEDALDAICNIANTAGADVFVSLHLNAAGNTDAAGPETYYLTGSTNGRKLAESVHHRMVDNLGAGDRDRGIKEAGFYVLKHTNAPAILIEAGFITNIWEEAQIHEQWFKDAVVKAIVDGVIKFMEVS